MRKGFTLIELLVVLAVVAVLVALAIPSWTTYVRKANRAEAQQLLVNWANNQEIWRANNPTYADGDDISEPTHDRYTFSVGNVSATTFTLTADPSGDQVNDKDQGVTCDPLTLTESGDRGPDKADGTPACWGRY